MRFINISIVSNNTRFLWAIMGDCINCMKHLLELNGYKVILTENTFITDGVNIIWGIGTHQSKDYNSYMAAAMQYKTIFVNMEQLGSSSILVDKQYLDLISRFKVIDYNSANLRHLHDRYGLMLGAEFPFIPVSLTSNITTSKLSIQYDFAFFGALNERRETIINELINDGMKIKIINGKYGDELSTELVQCKALLNIHYYTTSLFEVARCLRPASLGLPILSETSVLPTTVEWGKTGIQFFDYELIRKNAKKFLHDKNTSELSRLNKSFSSRASSNTEISSIINLINS